MARTAVEILHDEVNVPAIWLEIQRTSVMIAVWEIDLWIFRMHYRQYYNCQI
jgi:hypothetical protein